MRYDPSRREFLAALAAAPLLGRQPSAVSRQPPAGRLRSRPGRPTRPATAGAQRLNPGRERDAILYVPASYRPTTPAPFVLALHGAGGSAEGPTNFWREAAEARGLVVLSPDSRDRTWDAVLGDYGPDVTF